MVRETSRNPWQYARSIWVQCKFPMASTPSSYFGGPSSNLAPETAILTEIIVGFFSPSRSLFNTFFHVHSKSLLTTHPSIRCFRRIVSNIGNVFEQIINKYIDKRRTNDCVGSNLMFDVCCFKHHTHKRSKVYYRYSTLIFQLPSLRY